MKVKRSQYSDHIMRKIHIIMIIKRNLLVSRWLSSVSWTIDEGIKSEGVVTSW